MAHLVLANVALALLGAVLLWRSALASQALHRSLSQTQRLAATDVLTGLPNRTGLHQEIERRLAAGRTANALLVADICGFKFVNDTLGHDVGDALLVAAAARIRSCLSDDMYMARLGSDEFTILVEGADAGNRLETLAGALHQEMRQPFDFNADAIDIKLSIGLAAAMPGELSAGELVRRADVALHVAKAEKHLAFKLFSPDLDDALRLRRTIGVELDRALGANKLQLVYQPLVCARTGRVMSAEALMRWPEKTGSAGSPGVFIPIAEETGLITRLGDWALEQAILEIKRQRHIPIAVNVSPVQFRGETFANQVEAAIARHSINPNLLRIEITEGVLISHTGEAQSTMRRLRAMGVQVLLDDFGTGYSSLSYLQQFEFDGLKIDRAFIQQVQDGRSGRHLLKSIIALGHSLNMKVIAEGVETEAQAAILQLLSCDYLQGYALGHPDTADKLHAISRPIELLGGDRKGPAWDQAFG